MRLIVKRTSPARSLLNSHGVKRTRPVSRAILPESPPYHSSGLHRRLNVGLAQPNAQNQAVFQTAIASMPLTDRPYIEVPIQ